MIAIADGSLATLFDLLTDIPSIFVNQFGRDINDDYDYADYMHACWTGICTRIDDACNFSSAGIVAGSRLPAPESTFRGDAEPAGVLLRGGNAVADTFQPACQMHQPEVEFGFGPQLQIRQRCEVLIVVALGGTGRWIQLTTRATPSVMAFANSTALPVSAGSTMCLWPGSP